MAYFAEASEVARMAMNIEDAGNQFYLKLAATSSDEEAKSLFVYLAKQEEQHKIIFGTILQQTAKEQGQQEYVIDVLGLMKIMLDDIQNFVFNAEKADGGGLDLFAAVKLAIHGETESIRVYREIRRVYTNTFTQVLSKIIDEEQKHYKILSDFQSKLHVE
jgi:rubrerythrin